jgi:photosystem II stability/assembly factor-like uncharacterized protein/TolA-binding protein
MRPFLLALIAGFAFELPLHAAEVRYVDDATLHAVQFIDADVGWAVGDEGVIWKTINGGKTWERQPSSVRGSLRSLHMLSHLCGWVVGREELPSGGSTGIVLSTDDGGENWNRRLPNAVPGLNHVCFGDEDTGYLVGDGSDLFPTGVFLTDNGGKTWRPLKGTRCTSWLGGDFLDGKTGALAGAWSRLGTLREGGFGKADVDQFGGRNVRAMQLRKAKSFAVGQGGLVLESQSAGSKWGFTVTKLSEEVLATWDFYSVCCLGDKVWIVGRPGSAILCSDDRGATWKVFKTGQPLPLNGVHFFDAKRGWAVGEFGTILATGDGGATWTLQHRGGKRAAVLCVHARNQDLPVDTLAALGAEQGYLMATMRMCSPDPRSDSLAAAAQPQRWAAAGRTAGAASGEMLWQFPLPQYFSRSDKNSLLKFWNTLHGDHAEQQLMRQLVLALRMWRPDVVITDHPDAQATGNAAGALIAQALHEAFKVAADPKMFPEQIEQLGLETWQVKKVCSVWNKRDGAHLAFDTNAEGQRIESTYGEFAAHAASLLGAVTPPQRYYRVLDSNIEGATNHKHLLEGMPPLAVGVGRRALAPLLKLDDKLVAAIKEQRQLLILAKNPGHEMFNPNKLLGQLGPVLARLPDERGSKAAFTIASEFARQGQWQLAREAFLEMIDRYPAHPLSVDAYRWLIQHSSSSEARRRNELGQFLVVGQSGDVVPAICKEQAGDPKALKPANLQQGTYLANPAQVQQWHQGSVALAKRLGAFGAVIAHDPSIQFCVQASLRQLGDLKAAQQFYTNFCANYPDGPWRDVAAQELWFANRQGTPPRPVGMCRLSATKPYLDGNFDDACWQDLKPMVLKNALHETDKDYKTEAMFAYDEKFLYIALRCTHPKGQHVPPAKVRPRDADLRAFDRVSIVLDLDRDYSTFFRLEIDQRGCVSEDCWGDQRWNPQWFVAIKSDDESWNIEAAIPLSELTGDRIQRGAAWAINVVRILPGRGVQAWSTPAGVEPRPEGMGLLIFQQEAAPQSPMPAAKMP